MNLQHQPNAYSIINTYIYTYLCSLWFILFTFCKLVVALKYIEMLHVLTQTFALIEKTLQFELFYRLFFKI